MLLASLEKGPKGKYDLEMKDSFLEMVSFHFCQQRLVRLLRSLDGTSGSPWSQSLGYGVRKNVPLARLPKASVCSAYPLTSSKQDVMLFYCIFFRVKPRSAHLAACGLLFLSASSQQALSKTTVTWMMTQINYSGCLHKWTGNRQAVGPLWLLTKMYPSFICLAKLIRTFV